MPNHNQFKLLKENRFLPFFITQFLGAFNDNVFRNGLIIAITFKGIDVFGLEANQLANVAGALFMLPYFLLSANAGQFSDKYEKSGLMRIIKLSEIILMIFATIAFINNLYSILFVILFLMGCQSTFFGPVKYSYLPQNLKKSELIGGNALVESGTYIAIILGLIIGGTTIALGGYVWPLSLIGLAILGYIASKMIPITPAVDPELILNWNNWLETKKIMHFAKNDNEIFIAIMGISWFWLYGAAMTMQVPAYTLEILNGNEKITTILLAGFAIGVGIGALICEKLSKRKIEIGLVPIGSIGLSLFTIDLWVSQPESYTTVVNTTYEFFQRSGSFRIIIDIILIGAFGGLFSVPLYAFIQTKSPKNHLSRIIAANNIFNSLFVVSASIIAIILLNLEFSIPEVLLVFAIMNIIFAIIIYSLMPKFLTQTKLWWKNLFNKEESI